MESVFSKTFSISSYELNPRAEARLTTMANYFQEVAYHHASELGFGYNDMKSRRTMWLLSRMRIQLERYPRWDDQIEVRTWPSGVDKLFAIRDFKVFDSKGGLMGMASTNWLIVDVENHRPIRPGEEMAKYSSITYGDPVFKGSLGKIMIPEDMPEVTIHKVVFSDLDIMGHTNNVKYIEWCVDASHLVRNYDGITGFEINYMKETRMGDEVSICGMKADDASGTYMLFSGIRVEDHSEVFRVRIDVIPQG